MTRALVIGYGNPLRGDDGLGWEAARRLQRLLRPEDAVVMPCHQLTPELAEPISRANQVIFIDSRQGKTPGETFCDVLEPGSLTNSSLDHDVHPSVLLRYAQELYRAAPKAMLFSVTGQTYGYGQCLSPAVSNALDQVVVRIQEWFKNPERSYSHA